MTWLMVSILAGGYGIYYAIHPLPYLQRRMKRQDIPQTAVKTARMVGVALAMLGVASAIYQAIVLGYVG